jgi:hypothetical protein
MKQKRQRPQTLKVQRMYEPDRISPMNLQTAYESLVPPQHYRLVASAPHAEKVETSIPKKEEVVR